jgi:broad specificity phosphatase PhoE
MRSDLDITFWCIRHGKTKRNIDTQFIGQDPEEPLIEEGKQQAKLLGTRLDKEIVFDVVYCSDFLRAKETRAIAIPKPKHLIEVASLREINQGDARGKLRSEMFNAELKQKATANGMGFHFPNGESAFDVEWRASKWLEKEVLDNHHTRMDKHLDICLLSHGMTIRCLLHYVMAYDHHINWRIELDNTSISKLRYRHGLWSVFSINDTAHLHSLA